MLSRFHLFIFLHFLFLFIALKQEKEKYVSISIFWLITQSARRIKYIIIIFLKIKIGSKKYNLEYEGEVFFLQPYFLDLSDFFMQLSGFTHAHTQTPFEHKAAPKWGQSPWREVRQQSEASFALINAAILSSTVWY